jgi:hypothetical protein
VDDLETLNAAKADLLRHEFLWSWREGGVYMDADSIWLNRSFDLLIDFAKETGMFAVYHFDNRHSKLISRCINFLIWSKHSWFCFIESNGLPEMVLRIRNERKN